MILGLIRVQVKDPDGLIPGTCRKSRRAPYGTIPGVQNPKIWVKISKNVGFTGFPGRNYYLLIINPEGYRPLQQLLGASAVEVWASVGNTLPYPLLPVE